MRSSRWTATRRSARCAAWPASSGCSWDRVPARTWSPPASCEHSTRTSGTSSRSSATRGRSTSTTTSSAPGSNRSGETGPDGLNGSRHEQPGQRFQDADDPGTCSRLNRWAISAAGDLPAGRASARPRFVRCCRPLPSLASWRRRADRVHGAHYYCSCPGSRCSQPGRFTLGSTPATPIDGPLAGTSRNFTLPSTEGGQDFSLLALGHLEVIKSTAKFRMDFVEHLGSDLQVEMCIAQLTGCILKWPARQRGDPQCPQPLEARQPPRVRHRMPFPQLTVCPTHLPAPQQLAPELLHSTPDGEDFHPGVRTGSALP